MDKRKTEKAASLWLSLILLLVYLFAPCSWETVGLHRGCSPMARLCYPFFHANLLHLAINSYALLTLVFISGASLWRMLLGYIVAVSIPITTIASLVPISDKPIVGLSGVIFFMMGALSFEVKEKIYFQLCIWSNLFLQFFLPATSMSVHMYCFVIGVLWALLNKPISK